MYRFAAIAALSFLLTPPSLAATGKILEIISGDELKIEFNGEVKKVRLFGVDAPEPKQEFGADAVNFVQSTTKDKNIDIELVTLPSRKLRKRYGQAATIKLEDGSNLGELLLDEGLAWWDSEVAASNNTFSLAETNARRRRKGLWNRRNPQAPWVYRRGIFSQAIREQDELSSCSQLRRYCPANYAPEKCSLYLPKRGLTFTGEGTNQCRAFQITAYQACRAGSKLKPGRGGILERKPTIKDNQQIRSARILVAAKGEWKKRRTELTCERIEKINVTVAATTPPVKPEPTVEAPVQIPPPSLVPPIKKAPETKKELVVQTKSTEDLARECMQDKECQIVYAPTCQKQGCKPPCGEVHSTKPIAVNTREALFVQRYLDGLAEKERALCAQAACDASCKGAPPAPAFSNSLKPICHEKRCKIEFSQ